MACTFNILFRSTTNILKPSLMRTVKYAFFQPQVMRHLYSKATLGLETFETQKQRTTTQFQNMQDKFREKMKEFSDENSKSMIFTEDLKNMIHLADNDDDVYLVINMMKKFNQQNKQLRFGTYMFGPVVMRMLYVLNKPDEALECFKMPELEGFFDQLVTYQILFDLLYENKRYNEILEAFNLVKEKQIQGIRFPKNVVCLMVAACYKLNTPESLKLALKLWSEIHEAGHFPMRRAITFFAGLALNQKRPDMTLEILSTSRNQTYTTVRNLKVLALAEIGRVEDVIPILKSILSEDAPQPTHHTFNRDIINKLNDIIAKNGNLELKTEYNRIRKYLEEQGHITDTTLDEQMCTEIVTPPHAGPLPRLNRNIQQQTDNRRNQYKVYVDQRPGLKDIY